jgi:hypothetical protein
MTSSEAAMANLAGVEREGVRPKCLLFTPVRESSGECRLIMTGHPLLARIRLAGRDVVAAVPKFPFVGQAETIRSHGKSSPSGN